jgi:multidrug efflux system outer membrane protein
MIRLKFCVAGAALLLAACAVGPDYKRPALDVPAEFRGARPEAAQSAAFADLQWWAVLEDPILQRLIKDAFTDNYDLRIAANHVLQAREQLGITRANQLPSLGGFVEAERERAPPVAADQSL